MKDTVGPDLGSKGLEHGDMEAWWTLEVSRECGTIPHMLSCDGTTRHGFIKF